MRRTQTVALAAQTAQVKTDAVALTHVDRGVCAARGAVRNRRPPDVETGCVDSLHAYSLRECEKAYKGDFWRDFFKEVAASREELEKAKSTGDSTAVRNEEYRITVECMDRMQGLEVKRWLQESGISTTGDVKPLARNEGWNRRLE